MIILNKQDNNYKKDESTYLYVIADIYKRYSSFTNPLKDVDVVRIMSSKYNLKNIDRHIIKKYRDKLSDLGFVTKEYTVGTTDKKERKGFFFVETSGGISDRDLTSIFYLTFPNIKYKLYKEDDKIKEIEDTLKEYILIDEYIKLLDDTKNIIRIDDDRRIKEFSNVILPLISTVMKAIKNDREISSKIKLRDTKHIYLSFFPQAIFTYDNTFYVFGTTDNNKYIYKIEHLSNIKIIGKTNQKLLNSKYIKEYLESIDEIIEGKIERKNLIEAEFITYDNKVNHLNSVLTWLDYMNKPLYRYKRISINGTNRYKISIKASEEFIIEMALKNIEYAKLEYVENKTPKELYRLIHKKINELNESVKNIYLE